MLKLRIARSRSLGATMRQFDTIFPEVRMVSSRSIRRGILVCAGVGLMGFAAACSESAPPPPPPPPAPVVKTAQERAAMYQACWQQFNDKAWDKFQNCYTETATSE